jgi:hypothetical protein
MKLARTKISIFLTVLAALALAVTNLWALEPGADGYYKTGEGIRVKTVVLVDVNVYRITHYMKQLPASKSKRAVIDMDTDKKFAWTMMRDVDNEKIQGALKDAFAMNGYTDQAKISKFTGAFSGELKENARVTIAYSSDKKSVSVTVGGGRSATIEGVEFMKAVWSIWLGKIDQSKLGVQLIGALP